MRTKLRARLWTRGGLVGLVAAGILAAVPVSPAAAVQTIAWTATPASSGTLGSATTFAWTGTANTFLGARITGCFATFPDGISYSSSFNGNFTTGNCQYTKVLSALGSYSFTVGFNLSTGAVMTQQWTVGVTDPTPTVTITDPGTLTATQPGGAVMPALSAYGSDAAYGTSSATCTPAAGTVVSAPSVTATCSATNAGGKTGRRSIVIPVNRGTAEVDWSLSSSYPGGTTWGQIATATVSPSDLIGTMTYRDSAGKLVTAGAAIPVGSGSTVYAQFVPSGVSTANWNSRVAIRTITVLPTAQAVAFAADTPTDTTYGDAPFPVTATGTAGGGNVSIRPQPGSACTLQQSSTGTSVSATVTLTGVGACVLLADQAATTGYTAAPTAQASVTVAKRTSTITWAPSAIQTYGEPLAGLLTATADAPGTIAYTVNGDPVSASTVLAAGAEQPIVATFTPTDPGSHTGAVATLTVSVLQAPQTLDVAPIADATYGVAPFELDVSGTGPGAVSAEATGSCTVSGTTVTVVTAGDCTVTVSKAGTANHLAATPLSRTFSVSKAVANLTWDAPADIGYGTPLGGTQLDAVLDGTGHPAGAIAYTLADGTSAVGKVLPAGDHELTATWTPVDPGWKSATATVTLTVGKAVPELTWPVPAAITHGTSLGGAQLNAVAALPGTLTYAVDGTPAAGQVLAVGDHTLMVTFVPDDADNYLTATLAVPITVSPQSSTPDTLGPEAQHQIDEQRVETQADLSAGETRTFAVTCPSGYVATDGSGRVDAVDQGTGTLADVLVRESRSTSLDIWTVTMVNHATGRAQGKVFADCVRRETAEVDGHRHSLVLDQATPTTRALTGPTTVTVSCADGQYPVAPGYELDGDAVVRRSAASGASAWTFEVVPSGATTGTFSARCLAGRVANAAAHDHRVVLGQVAQHLTVDPGQAVEAQTTCGDLARGIVGGWSLDDGLVLLGAEPRAKTRATRLLNPTDAPLSADLTLQCLETRTEGGGSSTTTAVPLLTAPVIPPVGFAAPPRASIASLTSRAVTVATRGRTTASVSCAAGETTCTGTVRLVALRTQRVVGKVLRKGTVLGAATFSVAAGSVDRVVLRATRRGQRVLPAVGLRRAQLRIGDQVRTVSLRR